MLGKGSNQIRHAQRTITDSNDNSNDNNEPAAASTATNTAADHDADDDANPFSQALGSAPDANNMSDDQNETVRLLLDAARETRRDLEHLRRQVWTWYDWDLHNVGSLLHGERLMATHVVRSI